MFGTLNFLGKTIMRLIFFPLLFWGCMIYRICSVLLMVLCTIHLLHVLHMMIYFLAYCELLLLSLVGLRLFVSNPILQICGCMLIGGEELLIVWKNLDWLLPAVVICPTTEGGRLYLLCMVPPWIGFWRSVWLSLNHFPYDDLGKLTDTGCPWLSLSF